MFVFHASTANTDLTQITMQSRKEMQFDVFHRLSSKTGISKQQVILTEKYEYFSLDLQVNSATVHSIRFPRFHPGDSTIHIHGM